MAITYRLVILAVIFLACIEVQNLFSFAYHSSNDWPSRRRTRQKITLWCGYNPSKGNLIETDTLLSTTTDVTEILQAYSDWRKEYGKGNFDSIRFQNFKINFIQLISVNYSEKKKASENGDADPILMTLNEYGDYSAQEFIAMQQDETTTRCCGFSLLNAEEQNRIRQIYQEWCLTNGKIYDESRLNIFTFNLDAVEKYYEETGKIAELNKYANLSPEEFRSITITEDEFLNDIGSTSSPLSQYSSYLETLSSVESLSSISTSNQYQYLDETERDIIRQMYAEWCTTNKREFIESRLEVFANNFLAVERYRHETGKNVKLSEYADLSLEEYNAMTLNNNDNDNSSRTLLYGNSYLENLANPSLNKKSGPTTGFDNVPYYKEIIQDNTIKGISSMTYLTSSELNELPHQSTEPLIVASDQVFAVYQDWCQYFGKMPTEAGLNYFTETYHVLKKHYQETGEELTLDENADLPGIEYTQPFVKQEGKNTKVDKSASEETWSDEARIKSFQDNEGRTQYEKSEIEKNNIDIEKARLLHDDRQQYNSLTKSGRNFPEETLTNKELEKRRLSEEKDRVKEDLRTVDELRIPNTSTMTMRIENGENKNDTSNLFFLPQGSYMNAVAKTWVDRSAYLESLQQGRTGGVLPQNPTFTRESRKSERLIRNNSSKSLMDSLRHRTGNENGAERSRTETKEWEQIKMNLEQEATGARKRREFSFFSEKPETLKTTQPWKKVESKNYSWMDKLFNFFEPNDSKEEVLGLGTITLKPAKRTSVFDLFVNPDVIAPTEPGQGSITIEDSPKPSMLSFFAKFRFLQKEPKIIAMERREKVIDYESKLRRRQEKLSWLQTGRSRILEQKDKKMSRSEARRMQREFESLVTGSSTASVINKGIPQISKWTVSSDSRVTGWISSGSRYKIGTKITTSQILQGKVKVGMIVTTVSGSQYRLGLNAAYSDPTNGMNRSSQRTSRNALIPTLFSRLFAENDVPILKEWVQDEAGTLTGLVINKKGFADGTQITTSPVKKGARVGMIVQTEGGSKYKLLRKEIK